MSSTRRLSAERDRRLQAFGRLQALGNLVATFEAAHGEITEAEVVVAGRAARERAIVVRGAGR